LLFLGFAPISLAQAVASSGAGQESKTAEQAYKNIRVLKGIPAGQLMPAMQFITDSLGVECSFCHVENHFDQDDKKPKQTARKMMQMMMTINRDNFEGSRKVTCNTCHRGSPTPVGIPAIAEIAGAKTSATDFAAPTLPGADELLNKYIAASGGEQALNAVTTRVVKGAANFAGREVPLDIYDKVPGKRVSLMHLPNGDSATGFDGTHGWLVSPGRPAHEMNMVELEGARMDADLQFPLHLKRMFPDLKPAAGETINGRGTYQLLSENKDQPRLRLYFDQETGLLLRLIRYQDSPLGLNPVQIDYADYRAVNRVQLPFRWTVARPSGQFTIQASEITQNVPVEDSKFLEPRDGSVKQNQP
jgi:hypothetical protein